MVYLSDRATGRDNNLNLIRAIAASAVLVSHAYPITYGPGLWEPLKGSLGHSLGAISVYVFFAISGFLISMSFERSSSWTSFMVARILRLVPGLLVSLMIVAFILGPLVTSLPQELYWSDPRTYLFVLRNVTLVSLQFTLPGVFETLPFKAVEGSIWTLFHEVVCYLGVFVLGILGLLRKRLWMIGFFLAYFALWFAIEINGAPHPRISALQDLSLPFVIGMVFYLWRERLPLLFTPIVILTLATWVCRNWVVYDFLLVLTLSYATFWAGYIPGGILRAYNRVGDYSYGIYIYAFPFQGLAIWLTHTQYPIINMLISFPLTLIVSIASWHLIEEPALAMKSAVVKKLQRS